MKEEILEKKLERERQKVNILEKMIEDRTRELYIVNEYLQNINNSMADTLIVVNPDGTIRSANRAALNMLGYTEDELRGKDIETLFEKGVGTGPSGFGRQDSAARSETTCVTKAGRNIPVILSRSTMKDLDGAVLGVVCLALDISERKKTEEKLRKAYDEIKATQDASLSIMEDMEIQRKKLEATVREKDALMSQVERANKELQDFAYIVSHDLKAPLRAIGTISSWIAEDYKDKLDDAGREQLFVLLQRTKRMHDMIEGILQYSRVGRIKGTPETIDTGKVAEQVREALSSPANMQIKIHAPMPAIFIDPVQINQIIQNLISNAIKYMDKPEGLVEVGCRDAGEFWEFYVKDNGPGIEEKHFERIFQIFQTLKARDEFESTGIGLTIVKKIIEQSGGRVWVESEVGNGSTFKFTIPKGTTPPTSLPPL
ncbi:MAG: ATP-binding protein [Deltaproteobacteria bacterium]